MSESSEAGRKAKQCNPAQWLESHGDVLYRFALARVRRRDLAEDLVQETLLGALGSYERFDGRSSERVWLIAILRRKIVDHIRRAIRRRETGERPIDEAELAAPFDEQGYWRKTLGDWPGRPDGALERQEFWRVFDDCAEKLPPRLSEAFILREFEGAATDEICKTLHITPTNLAVRLHRARLLLRECLERNWFSDEA